MVFRKIKHIIVLALICGIIIPSFAQKGTFNKAMKQGKKANGYYHAVFTHTAYSKKRLAKFAGRQGYYLTNMTEEKVLQFGDCSSAVVSLDFLSIDEIKTRYKDAIDAAMKKTGIKYPDVNIERKILAGAVNSEGEIVTIQDYNTFELTKENIEKDWNKHVCAGLDCGFFCIDFISGNPNTYRYVSFETVNSRLAKQFNLKNIASSSGSGYVNMNKNGFENVNDIIWSGNCVDGKINDYGIGYTMSNGKIIENSVFRFPNPEKYYTMEGTIINCFVGSYKNGKPTGECKYYSFNIKDLLEDKAFGSPTTIKIYPFNEGLARCDMSGNINYIDHNYVVKLSGVNKIKYLKYSNSNNVVKDFENGLLTLNSKIDKDKLIEFYVNKKGEFVSLTKNGQALVDSIIDETVIQYNNYISKVFNLKDILKPSGTLKKHFNYDLNSFPSTAYWNITNESICEEAVANYKKRKANNYDKSDYAAKVVHLMSELVYFENFDKTQYEKDFEKHTSEILNANRSFYSWFGKISPSYNSTFTPKQFEYRKETITDILKEIGKKKQKPSNFQQIEYTVNKYCNEYATWWASIYAKADRQVDNLIAEMERDSKRRRQEMCSKCKIDGKKTVSPEGYYEGYESWFTYKPAESETEGEIVFVNGQTCKWKYIYKGPNSYEINYIEVEGTFSGKYKTHHEMMIGLTQQCTNRWCH